MNLGGIDTLILLTSSWSVALGIQALKRDLVDRVPRYLLGGVLTGLMFMVSKSIEYFEKFAEGITPGTNDFYMWYFTLTGIHLLHVVFGTTLLTYLWIRSRRRAYSSLQRVVPECVASYWHLVDLLWIVIFPCSTYRRQPDVGVARTAHHGVAGPDGADLRDDMGAVEGSVQSRRRGDRDLRDRRGEVSYVMLDFMELRDAPIPIRVAFQSWPVAVAAMILGFWFATPALM